MSVAGASDFDDPPTGTGLFEFPTLMQSELVALADAPRPKTSAEWSDYFDRVHHFTDSVRTLPDQTPRVATIQAENSALVEVNEELRKKELRSGRIIDMLQDQLATANSGDSDRPSKRREKIPDPALFSGAGGQQKFDSWMASMNIKFDIDADRFSGEKHKLGYLFGRLEGSAKQLLRPYFNSADGSIGIATVKDALDILRQHYEDPDRLKTAEFEIKRLRQKNNTFSQYLSDFSRLAAELNWNSDAKLSLLREGLSSELKTALVYRDVPNNFDDFAALCMKQDNQLRRYDVEHRRSGTTSATTFRPFTTSATSSLPVLPASVGSARPLGPEPMDLSSSTRGPLTAEERLRRIQESLCLYCGKGGHVVRDCPENRKPKSRLPILRVAEASVSDVGTGSTDNSDSPKN